MIVKYNSKIDSLVIAGQRAKNLPVRRWDRSTGTWIAPYATETWDALRRLGADVTGITPPTEPFSRVETYQRALAIFLPPSTRNIASCRDFPDRRTWKKTFKGTGAWLLAATPVNVAHILKHWPNIHWTEEAAEVRDGLSERDEVAEVLASRKTAIATPVGDYRFGGQFEPYEHQRRAFSISRDTSNYALFMDPGTGKTRVIVDTACYLFGRGDIDAVMVISPNSVKDVWSEEITLHSPDHYQHAVRVYSSGSKKADKLKEDEMAKGQHDSAGRLSWWITNVEAMSSVKGRAYKLAMSFLKTHRVLLVVDESSKIKSHGAKRTRNITRAGKSARYRRILTGTPSTQGPLDLFAQFRFLDPHILGFGSFYAFRNRYALIDNRQGYPQILGYQNIDELKDLIDPYAFRVTRDECLDLPPKVYQRRDVKLSAQQRRHYVELAAMMRTEFEGREISVINALTQLLRLQQIVGGFLPAKEVDALERVTRGTQTAERIPGPNPKLIALTDLIEDLPERDKVVIWARFRPEIDLINTELSKLHGDDSVVDFHGGRDTEYRTWARQRFQDPDSGVRFFIAQTETGGIGLTLTAANTVVYYSNSFSLESRIQSEDRCHRIGQERTVNYIDLVAKSTLDIKVLSVLRTKKKLADQITGDKTWMDWI